LAVAPVAGEGGTRSFPSQPPLCIINESSISPTILQNLFTQRGKPIFIVENTLLFAFKAQLNKNSDHGSQSFAGRTYRAMVASSFCVQNRAWKILFEHVTSKKSRWE